MLPGFHLPLLVLCIAGCAGQLLVVPESDWQTVPPAQRAALDRQHETQLAAARAELTAASAGLAELRESPPAAAAPRPTAGPAAGADDEWLAVMHEHEQARAAAFTRVEQAKLAWQHDDRRWRELRVDAAEARLELMVSQRELVRAQTIDHNLPGNDHYEVAPLRGQFSRAQRQWYVLADSARQARAVLERTSATLASSKEAYAQLMRNGPPQLAAQRPEGADERSLRLELTGWSIERSDIGRRRGLRHYLETTAAGSPQLRKRTFQLSPLPRTAMPEVPAAPAARASAGPAGKAPAATATATTTATGPKPWDVVEPGSGNAGKPAATVPPSAPATAPRTSPPATATATSAKPWDFLEPTAGAAGRRPAPTKAARVPLPTAGAAVADKPPAEAPATTGKPAAEGPAPTGKLPAPTGKPAAEGPVSTAKPATTGPAGAGKPTATAAKPAERATQQVLPAPTSTGRAPAGVAKPVQAPRSPADSPAR